ncbi:hypothetical protein [Anabaena sp. 4-3]|uniref:hypothetical protein n=1 Tax=Anabaena sp. 4-3 TaxID=1811979 RepID=UPI000A63AE24|nr:hypothetical protein [Anabaena sp. 4-3]
MFAWYVKTGKQYSGQTEEIRVTKFGAAFVSLVQPVHTVRSIKYLEIEKAIVANLQANLDEVNRTKLMNDQAARDDFWQRRDAGLIQANLDDVKQNKLMNDQAARDDFWQRRDAGLS